MNILDLAQSRIPDLKKKTAKEWAGPCPHCGGTDRFLVWTHRDAWHCRGCDDTGDVIKFFMKFDGMSCPEAHEAAGEDCHKHSCPMWDKCRLGARAAGDGQQQKKKERISLQPPMPEEPPQFVPTEADTPEQIWMQQAAQLVEKAHAALLETPEQIDYLTKRGIPLEAIQQGQLGHLPQDRFPTRESWGLPTELKENDKPKKLLVPAGILIPFFDAQGQPHRIRIRRSNPPAGAGKYYWLPGSGNDVPVIGAGRAVVVVESDLDAFMVRLQCRDLDVAVIPLGTCSAKPKGWAMQALEQALAILVAHDFEPRVNQQTGKHENPGGQGARWWLQQFKRAKRWPVPSGKDPGEYYEQGGNIREWILAGLPPAFQVKAEPPKQKPRAWKLLTSTGRELCIVADPRDRQDYFEQTGLVTLSEQDLDQLKKMEEDAREETLQKLEVFGGEIECSGRISEKTQEWLDGLSSTPAETVPLLDEPIQECLL